MEHILSRDLNIINNASEIEEVIILLLKNIKKVDNKYSQIILSSLLENDTNL